MSSTPVFALSQQASVAFQNCRSDRSRAFGHNQDEIARIDTFGQAKQPVLNRSRAAEAVENHDYREQACAIVPRRGVDCGGTRSGAQGLRPSRGVEARIITITVTGIQRVVRFRVVSAQPFVIDSVSDTLWSGFGLPFAGAGCENQ